MIVDIIWYDCRYYVDMIVDIVDMIVDIVDMIVDIVDMIVDIMFTWL